MEMSVLPEAGKSSSSGKKNGLNPNMIFRHTGPGQELTPINVDDEDDQVDSEAETADNKFHTEYNGAMIDDLAYLNDGEKEFMKMWNIHMLTNKRTYAAGMKRVPLAVMDFVRSHGEELVQRKLINNFTLHLLALTDLNLLSAEQAFKALDQIPAE